MDIRSTFFFHGHAAAMSGRIYRPEAYDVEVACASALTPAGGISRATAEGRTFRDFITFGSAATLAEGRFQDEGQALALTRHEISEDQLRTRTRVSAEVTGLTVGRNPQFKMDFLRAELISTSPEGTHEPPIQLGDGTVFTGVSLGGYGLRITLNNELFNTCDTRSKLVAACQDRSFLQRHADSLLSRPVETAAPRAGSKKGSQRGATPLPVLRLCNKDLLYTTIVKKIAWTRKPHPDATIEGHRIIVKEFGTIYLGEFLIGEMSRQLLMARFEFGSPVGGRIGAGAVGSNGSWVP